ncbi:MAG: glycerophosphodiester phosphodiesterase [Lentisphaeria bacterium]|nr:glycerophosphodiester phosphodiesterase [Lentisphaeria bacterium]
MIWISHRGESKDAPENTVSAFQLSLDRKTDGMECDIHLTRDGKLVTCHDSDTIRTCGKSLVIEETNYDELLKLDASNGKPEYCDTRIPLFSETLKCLGNRLYFVEIKVNDPAVIEAMISELDKAGIPAEQVVMISFCEDIVRIFKERYPERKALWLTGFKVSADGTWMYSADKLIEKLRELKADGVDIHGNLVFINEEYVKKVKDAGFDFAVWTIDDEKAAQRFVDFKVDAITSNRAAYLRGVIGK